MSSEKDDTAEVQVPARDYVMSAQETTLYDTAQRLMRVGMEYAGIEPAVSAMLSGFVNEIRRKLGTGAAQAIVQGFADTMKAAAAGDQDPSTAQRVALNKLELAFQILADLRGTVPPGFKDDTCLAMGAALAAAETARSLARRDLQLGKWLPADETLQ